MQTSRFLLARSIAASALALAVGACSSKKDAPQIAAFSASSTSVASGTAVTLSWRVSNTTSVQITSDPGGATLKVSSEAQGMVMTAPIDRVTVFTLKATGDGGSASATVVVTLSSEGDPMIAQFAASPVAIKPGEMSTLSWNVTNAASVTIRDSADTVVYDGTNLMGMQVVSPAQTESYTLTAKSGDGRSASKTVLVVVSSTGGAQIVRFSAMPDAVNLGDPTALSWEVANAPGGVRIESNGETATVSAALQGMIQVRPAADARFVLIAFNPEGDAAREVSVAVTPGKPAIVSFDATPNPTGRGSTTHLSWSTVGADSLRLLRDTAVLFDTDAAHDPHAFDAIVPTSSATFSLVATNMLGSTMKTVTVTTRELPNITRFTALPLAFHGSATASVSWSTAGATSTALFANNVAVAGFPGGASGTFGFPVSATTEVTLVATNDAGSVSKSATLALLGTEAEPDDSPGSAIVLPAPVGAVEGTIGSSADLDFYAITVPTGGWVRARLTDGMGACPAGLILQLLDRDGSTTRGVKSLVPTPPPGPPSCSPLEIDPATDAFARNLAGGTYYLVVTAAPGQTPAASYDLYVQVGSPGCGNGYLELGEQCDDGNLAGADGCNAGCEIEPIGAVSGPGMSMTFMGSLQRPMKIDVYRVDMASRGYIAANLFVPSAPGCMSSVPPDPPMNKVTLTLVDAQLHKLTEGAKGATPDEPCAVLDPRTNPLTAVGAGTYFIFVSDDVPNGTIAHYAIEIRTFGPGCGNGVAELGELCDDGNMISGDGCSASCVFEGPSEMEPNDAFDASGVRVISLATTGSIARSQGAINPPGDRDYYAITMPQGHHLTVSLSLAGRSDCPMIQGPQLTVFGTDGLTPLASGGLDQNGCPRESGRTSPALFNMAAGTYYVEVGGGGSSSLPPYVLEVRITAPGCHNGFVDAGEACDDGNTIAGDGCNAMCQFELGGTIPATGGMASATALPGGVGVVAIDLSSAGQSITATVAAPMPNTCPFELSLRVADSAFAPVGQAFACSIGFPSLFATNLAPGRYYLIAQNSGPTALTLTFTAHAVNPRCGNGVVESRTGEQCDDRNVTSGDGCSATCQYEVRQTVSLPAGSPAVISGSLAMNQIDVYRINTTAAAYLMAQTFVPNRMMGCVGAASQTDTVISLADTSNQIVAMNDDQGGGVFCSRFTGARLAANATYYLSVRAYQPTYVITAYELALTTAPADVCGNGYLEIMLAEQCDDGNTMNGDGCSSTCQYEGNVTVEHEPNEHQSTANASMLTGTGTVTVVGTINPSGDDDVWSFTVPANQAFSFTARTYSVRGQPHGCDNTMTDTRILLERAGTEALNGQGSGELAYSDDIPSMVPDYCSLISNFMIASDPMVRTFYVRVQRFMDMGTATYLMDLNLR
jgi:cysteine-rich repeat protein